ncbi:MAG: hypothetical protein M1428_03850 [Deltaproteobacteria bacterium]|nr:hypothetical protein [Deltaproteobacteria bacterium]
MFRQRHSPLPVFKGVSGMDGTLAVKVLDEIDSKYLQPKVSVFLGTEAKLGSEGKETESALTGC